MTTKSGKLVHPEELTQKIFIKQVLVTSLRQDQATNEKNYFSTTSVSMTSKLGMLATYLDELGDEVGDLPYKVT